ncbi:hypothetical protein [Variovorax sp. EL159]|uniref:hypothetical protein n=1 Tax=Variovorax sp. EL159 TaxID=1566270 RepID=UPI00115FFB7D|nr:hypothetical protein [Variovorax sp. EL159]
MRDAYGFVKIKAVIFACFEEFIYSLAIKDHCIRYKKTGSDREPLYEASAHSLPPARLAALAPLVARARAEKKAPEGALFVVALS